MRGAELGKAFHLLLEHANLAALATEEEVQKEIQRLSTAGKLSAAQADGIDPEPVARFWASSIGSELRARVGA